MVVRVMHGELSAAVIKQRVDLLALIGQDTRLKRVAGTAGGEYAGPCPFCGGRDRLRVQPARRRWWCRRCGQDTRWEDAIDYVRKRDRVDFGEACRRLGAPDDEPGRTLIAARRPPGGAGPTGSAGTADQQTRQQPVRSSLTHAGSRGSAEVPTGELAADEAPTPAWQAEALRFVAEAEASLWSAAGERARAYLAWRGLREHTLRMWRIGFQPREGRRDPAAAWGFPELTATGQRAWLRIPRGIVIPWLLDGQVWQLKIRTNRDQPKYLAVSGGHPCLYGVETLVPGAPAILTEGEFDALLLWQEAGDLIGVTTLGSCSKRLSATALRHLLGCSPLLVAYDGDVEGDKGAERLAQWPLRLQRIRPPQGKDVTAFWQAGGLVRDWVRFELAAAGYPQMPR
jgi:DNA primase